MWKYAAGALIAGGLALSAVSPAMADRPPTDKERAAIEDVLRKEGFVNWKEIEFDDGVWEVDDARANDGKEYDLKLDPKTLEIIKRKLDD